MGGRGEIQPPKKFLKNLKKNLGRGNSVLGQSHGGDNPVWGRSCVGAIPLGGSPGVGAIQWWGQSPVGAILCGGHPVVGAIMWWGHSRVGAILSLTMSKWGKCQTCPDWLLVIIIPQVVEIGRRIVHKRILIDSAWPGLPY